MFCFTDDSNMNDGREELDKTFHTVEEEKEKPEKEKLKSKRIKELKDTSKEIQENFYGTDPGLKPENVASFVSKCTDGLLNHYEPTFKNIKKDLGIRLKIIFSLFSNLLKSSLFSIYCMTSPILYL